MEQSGASDGDPRGELAALVHGLRREVGRRSWLGQRTLRARSVVPEPVAELPRVELVPVPRMPPLAAPPSPHQVAPGCADLEQLRSAVAACRACGLCETRTNTVFMDGTGSSGILFVGEAPGEQEDLRGVPFVGAAGQLLTDIITKGMGLERSAVAIANVLKCRPPGNRDPLPEEKERCTPFLERQIELLRPRLVIALGKHAAAFLLGTEASLGQLRGRVHVRGAHKVVVTYHPAYLLRTPSAKKDCWQDIQLALRELGLPLPGRAGAPPAPPAP
ncbi:MAG: uracil-DNA glycosylase [Planctomycetes bacterium]|nr:uracil-DNA glycosylase [Planctomycetota bacterium]